MHFLLQIFNLQRLRLHHGDEFFIFVKRVGLLGLQVVCLLLVECHLFLQVRHFDHRLGEILLELKMLRFQCFDDV